jgi:RimJ/RimL family protein N-acetyltransferase
MSFETQPHLSGDLVRLRPLRESDFEELFSVASDPLIWEQHPDRDRYEPAVFARFFREAIESRGALAILDARNGRIIGSSRYHAYDAGKSEVEIGWTFLARAYWGGKYNGEVKQLMLTHAFKFVETVKFIVGAGNRRSARALEKIGAAHAGSARDASGRESVLYVMHASPEQ